MLCGDARPLDRAVREAARRVRLGKRTLVKIEFSMIADSPGDIQVLSRLRSHEGR